MHRHSGLLLSLVLNLLLSMALFVIYHQYVNPPIRIASIDFERVIKAQSQWLLQSDLDELERLTVATYLNQQLTQVLDDTAARDQVIFMNKTAVMSGVRDWTDPLLESQRQQFEQAHLTLNEADNETLVV